MDFVDPHDFVAGAVVAVVRSKQGGRRRYGRIAADRDIRRKGRHESGRRAVQQADGLHIAGGIAAGIGGSPHALVDHLAGAVTHHRGLHQHGDDRTRQGIERLAAVECTGRSRYRSDPGKIAVLLARAGQLNGSADRISAVFQHPDILGNQTSGRAVRRGKHAFIRQKLHHGVGQFDQRNAVGRAVLDTIHRIGKGHRAEAVSFVVNRAGQVGRAVLYPAIAVIQHQRVLGEVYPGGAGDFDELVDVGTHIIVVDFIDKNHGRNLPGIAVVRGRYLRRLGKHRIATQGDIGRQRLVEHRRRIVTHSHRLRMHGRIAGVVCGHPGAGDRGVLRTAARRCDAGKGDRNVIVAVVAGSQYGRGRHRRIATDRDVSRQRALIENGRLIVLRHRHRRGGGSGAAAVVRDRHGVSAAGQVVEQTSRIACAVAKRVRVGRHAVGGCELDCARPVAGCRGDIRAN